VRDPKVAEITVSINGRAYPVVCEDGKEEHVEKLATYLDQRVREVASSAGSASEARLMLLAALMTADELADAYNELADLRNRADGVPEIPAPAVKVLEEKLSQHQDAEARMAASLEALATRIEALAQRLEAR